MCFKQAIWKPLVNAFATMCGLVVPIALAHAWCALVQEEVAALSRATPFRRTISATSACLHESGFGAICTLVLCRRQGVLCRIQQGLAQSASTRSTSAMLCAIALARLRDVETDGQLGRWLGPRRDCDVPEDLESVVAVAAFHSLNHYHGQWGGRSWATSCGGCFETLGVCHWFKNECVHVFGVWLFAFVCLDFFLAM